MSEDLRDRLNESPWRGMVSEVGFGTPFTHSYLGHPGASKTILYACSPYSRAFQGDVKRSVSREGVIGMMENLENMCPEEEKAGPMFFLAISGAHKGTKERGDSHGWIALRTSIPREDTTEVATTLLHFRVRKHIRKVPINRFEAGNYIASVTGWLCKAMLLGEYNSWEHALSKQPYKDVLRIDIVEDPRISIKEHLSLVSFENPLLYHKGKFERVLDYTRKYDRYMSGSFNPPHKVHLDAGKDAVFMINFENARKEDISVEDMAHRIQMLNLVDVPVMILKSRPFVALQAHQLKSLGKEEFTFVTGVDTFNAVCNTKYIPVDEENLEQMMGDATEEQRAEIRENILSEFLQPIYEDSGVKFEVITREGHEIVDNQWSQKINFEEKESANPSGSSTQAREGDHSDLPEVISNYIKENNLYAVE